MTAAAGFFLACSHQVYWKLLLETLIGMALAIAAACVFNNVIDKGIDQKMARTKNRATVSGKISDNAALAYGSVLLILGLTELSLTNNGYVFGLVAAAVLLYVGIYGWAKRNTVHSTLIGAIPGAVPPAAGYLAVTNHINAAAVLLFLAWGVWQLPHFYAIALYRYKDYQAAGLPVITVAWSSKVARRLMIIYVAAFGVACALLSILGQAGWSYLVVMAALSVAWIYRGISTWRLKDEIWGKKMFLFSLLVSLAWSVLTAVGGRLP